MTTTPISGGKRTDGDDDHFVIVPRPTIRDDRLSFRARGLLAFILDLPEGWEIRASWLATQGKEGEEAVYTALRELRTFGYYRVERRKGEGGRWISGTAVRKRASALWAAQYAAELEARAANRKVSLPVYAPGEDEAPVTDGDDMTAPADSGLPGNREAHDGRSGNRIPPSPKEEPIRRSEKGTSLPTGEGAHAGAHTREADDGPPQLALVAEPEKPAKAKRGKARREPRSISEDWALSDEMRANTVARYPLVDVDEEVAAFVNWHLDPSRVGQWSDYDRAWWNWVRKAKPKRSQNGRSGRPAPESYRNSIWEDGTADASWDAFMAVGQGPEGAVGEITTRSSVAQPFRDDVAEDGWQ